MQQVFQDRGILGSGRVSEEKENMNAYNIIGGGDPKKRSDRDFYPTPKDVTVALMEVLDLPKQTCIWEPACGDGHIINALSDMGYMNVIGTDIVTGTDYLTADKPGGSSL